MKTLSIKLSTLVALSAFAILPNAFAGGSSTAGVGNPSSKLCVKLGGKNVTVTEAAGEIGLCAFDKAQISAWTLWRHKNGSPQEAVKVFLKSQREPLSPTPMMPNPAAANCIKRAGQLAVVKDRTGGELALCTYADGSAIEEWTLFYGPLDSATQKLVRALVK